MEKFALFKLSFCLFSVLFNYVDGAAIGSVSFQVTAHAPQGYGTWTAMASCPLTFNTVSFGVGDAYILVKFGVPFTFVNDNSNGAIVDQASKWYVAQIGYGGSNSFTFTVTFTYDVWLASAKPSGSCAMYIGSSEALSDATTEPELIDTPADPLVATIPLVDLSASGRCSFSFAGIAFGGFETVIIVNFTAPVTNIGDYNGGSINVVADDGTWSIATNPQSIFHTFTYYTYFEFSTANQDVTNAVCYLYIASSLTGIDSSSSLDVIFSGGTPSTTLLPSTTMLTTSSVVNINDRDTMYEYIEMRDRFEESGNIWQLPHTNIVRCGRRCLADPFCASVFFEETSSTCTAHTVVHVLGSGTPLSNVHYFVVKG